MRARLFEALQKGATYVRDVQHGRSPHVIYLSGSPDSDNLGDNTLFKAHRALFPGSSFLRYGSGGRVVRQLSRLLRVSGHGLLAGGTLINRWGVGPLEECLELFGSFSVLGTGVGQADFWAGRSGWRDQMPAWKRVLERASYLGVRGPLSARALHEAGLPNAEMIGDPVLVFAEPGPPDPDAHQPATLGINLGISRGNVWGSEDRIARECAALARRARERGFRVEWFVVHPEDLEITRAVARSSGTEARVHEVYRDHTRFMEQVKPLSVFVGMKLHAVVLATCAYVPSVMLEYRPKCRDYMLSIDREAATVRTDRFDAASVWEMVAAFDAERAKHARDLHDSIAPVRDRLRDKAREIEAGFGAGR